MKAKFLLLFIVCAFLPVIAGCGTDENPDIQSDGYGYSAEQSSTADYSDDTVVSEISVMYITVNSNKLEVKLEENSSVTALVEILKQNDITYTASDYGNFEKVGNIGYTLPRNDEEITTRTGDVILYQGNNLCLYYGVNTWSFTRIGKIDGYTADGLKEILCAGSGSVQITLSLN